MTAEVVYAGTVPHGEPGPPGPPGPPGADGGLPSYHRHIQSFAAAVWEIPHMLGYYPGGIVVRDSGGEIHVGRIEYVDVNNLRISFFAAGLPTSFAGEADIS